MNRHYQPTGWLTTDTCRRGDKEYIYTIYRYCTPKGVRKKSVPLDLVPKVRKAITDRKPVKEVLAIIKGEEAMAIAS